jgi:FkbM family methyltransferase
MMLKKCSSTIYKLFFKMLAGHGIGNIFPFKQINRLILTFVKTTYAQVDGNKMYLDARDSLNLSIAGVHEKSETEIVKREIKKGDVALDIGANIGYYTLIFARLVGAEGKVFSFEPDPYNFNLLKKNVEINGYKNVELIQKAVSHQTGKTRLYFKQDNHTINTIYASFGSFKTLDIEAVSLDEYFVNYPGAIDFIKMDIQGAEGRAIQGMDKLLAKNRQIKIVMEYEPAFLIRSGMDPGECLRLLTDRGFYLYQIQDTSIKLKPVSIDELSQKFPSEKSEHTNLFCIREKI